MRQSETTIHRPTPQRPLVPPAAALHIALMDRSTLSCPDRISGESRSSCQRHSKLCTWAHQSGAGGGASVAAPATGRSLTTRLFQFFRRARRERRIHAAELGASPDWSVDSRRGSRYFFFLWPTLTRHVVNIKMLKPTSGAAPCVQRRWRRWGESKRSRNCLLPDEQHDWLPLLLLLICYCRLICRLLLGGAG